jgi:hypothetical protein
MPVNTDPVAVNNTDPIHINNTNARSGLTIRRPRNTNITNFSRNLRRRGANLPRLVNQNKTPRKNNFKNSLKLAPGDFFWTYFTKADLSKFTVVPFSSSYLTESIKLLTPNTIILAKIKVNVVTHNEVYLYVYDMKYYFLDTKQTQNIEFFNSKMNPIKHATSSITVRTTDIPKLTYFRSTQARNTYLNTLSAENALRKLNE